MTAKYVVIFKNKLSGQDEFAYQDMAAQMQALVETMPGFVKSHHFSNDEERVTLSYWSSLEAIKHWKENAAHQEAQSKGISTWYAAYDLDICEIIRSKHHASENK